MIHINDEYVVTNKKIGVAEYEVLKDTHVRDDAGNRIYESIGNYTSLPGAAVSIYRDMVKCELAQKDVTLKEAIKTMQDLEQKIITHSWRFIIENRAPEAGGIEPRRINTS